MKRFAAFALALTLFAAPAVALADDYGLSWEQMFDQYEDEETIVYGLTWEQIFDQYEETILHGE